MIIYPNNMKKGYFTIVFICIVKLLSAQNTTEKTFNVNFQEATISEFVNELEAKSGYHFYYDPAQFDSLKITI